MNRPSDRPAMSPGIVPAMAPATQTVHPAAESFAIVGRALPHESGHLHVGGAATYTDDLPELAGTLHAALGLSPVAHGALQGIDIAALRALPGVVDVIMRAFVKAHASPARPHDAEAAGDGGSSNPPMSEQIDL